MASPLRRLRLAGLLVMAMAGSAEAQTEFTPYVALSEIYTDNLALAPAGLEEDEFVTRLEPGFRFERAGSRLEADARYQAEALFFLDHSDEDEVFHQFQGGLNWVAIPETFFVDASAGYDQSLVDPEQNFAFSNVLRSRNRTDTARYSIYPYLDRNLGRTLNVQGGYRYRQVDYQEGSVAGFPLIDLYETRGDVSIGSVEAQQRRLRWNLEYVDRRIRYEDGIEFREERAGVDLGLRATSSVELLGRGGYETDLREDLDNSGFDTDYWAVGFAYRPNDSHHLQVLAGERFFGDTLEVDYQFTGRLLLVGAGYTEQPTTPGLSHFDRRVFDPQPDEVIPGIEAQAPEIYIQERARIYATLAGRRTTIGLTLYDENRDFFESRTTEDERGGVGSLRYQLGPRTAIGLGLDWRRIGFRGTERDDELSRGTLWAERQIGRSTLLALTLRHAERHSDSSLLSPLYEENAATLFLSREF